MTSTRRLRAVSERGPFRYRFPQLGAFEQGQVRAVLRALRVSEHLPEDEDVDDIIPPCLPVWRRAIPQTVWVLLYAVEGEDEHINAWTIKRL